MNTSGIPPGIACRRCGGRLEAAAKVYFDLTAAERRADGEPEITGYRARRSQRCLRRPPGRARVRARRLLRGLRREGRVPARRSRARPDPVLPGAAAEAEPLLALAREVYHDSRDGQAAVEAWARSARVAPHVSYRRCEPCEASTPHIAGLCAVCESGAASASAEGAR